MVADMQIFLARSKLRAVILKELNKEDQIASFLAKKLNKHREVISRVFSDFEKHGLVTCINPDAPHFRKYRLTNRGKILARSL